MPSRAGDVISGGVTVGRREADGTAEDGNGLGGDKEDDYNG